jgi:hypothetical protein
MDKLVDIYEYQQLQTPMNSRFKVEIKSEIQTSIFKLPKKSKQEYADILKEGKVSRYASTAEKYSDDTNQQRIQEILMNRKNRITGINVDAEIAEMTVQDDAILDALDAEEVDETDETE